MVLKWIDYLPNPNHYVRFGSNHTYHTFSPGSMDIYIYEIDSVLTDSSFNFSEKLYAHESFLYIDEIKVNDRLKMNLGFHTRFYVKEKFYQSIQPRFSSLATLSIKIGP